jgi:hypothetical protein
VEVLVAVVLVVAVAAFVTVPLRRSTADLEPTDDPVLADLEARKQAKYREIRDTELDRAQGKLTEEDFRRQDAELRAEAIEILKRIDARTGRGSDRGEDGPGPDSV